MVSSTSTTKQELGSFLERRLAFISPPLSIPNYWNKTHPSTGNINLMCWATEDYSKEPFFQLPAFERTRGQKSLGHPAGRLSWRPDPTRDPQWHRWEWAGLRVKATSLLLPDLPRGWGWGGGGPPRSPKPIPSLAQHHGKQADLFFWWF